MDLEVKRVLVNDVVEHEPVYRSVYIIPETVVKAEQGVSSEERTTLTFTWGEEITIQENVHTFKKRVDTYIETENEKRREEERNKGLGL